MLGRTHQHAELHCSGGRAEHDHCPVLVQSAGISSWQGASCSSQDGHDLGDSHLSSHWIRLLQLLIASEGAEHHGHVGEAMPAGSTSSMALLG